MNRDSNCPSGFSVLLHSRAVQWFMRIWLRANGAARPLLPFLHLFMLATTGTILWAVVFANQHAPCWYDEVYMMEPAYHRVVDGVWKSIGCWDSMDVIPYAPNYPLLCNILRLCIRCFGFDFQMLRAAMLASGLLPVALLLWLLRKKGVLQNGWEICQAAYFAACFTFFHWSIWIRPEAILLSVVTLLVFAWALDRPVLLFLSALLVPLCGFQWNILLLPVCLHWLVFGGRIRRPVLVFAALALSTGGTIVVYHILGMWPSYMQEAARVGGVNVLPSVLSRLKGAFAWWDFSWLFHPGALPFYMALPVFLFGILGVIGHQKIMECRFGRNTWIFVLAGWGFVVVGIALTGHLNNHYSLLLALPASLAFPVAFRRLFSARPLFLLCLVVLAVRPPAVFWNKVRCMDFLWRGVSAPVSWFSEQDARTTLAPILSPGDSVACHSYGYPTVRGSGAKVVPLCYAFNLSSSQIQSISFVLLEDAISPAANPDFAKDRSTNFLTSMADRLCPDSSCGNFYDLSVSPEELLAVIGSQWHCTFSEVPLSNSSHPGFMRYRLFRPVFENPFPQSQS